MKPRVSGNWGPTPGQNFIYVHLNRIIKENDLNVVDLAPKGGRRMGGNTHAVNGALLKGSR